jgi:hypothetical protein
MPLYFVLKSLSSHQTLSYLSDYLSYFTLSLFIIIIKIKKNKATLEGISEISFHCGKCIALVLLANRHAPNLDELMTIVVNVHMARVIG